MPAIPTNGRCHVCGHLRPLTEEHIIPRSAGNIGPLRVYTFKTLAMGYKTGRKFPNGLTCDTVCERCNGLCGQNYVAAFAEWTRQAGRVRSRLPIGVRTLVPFVIDALAVYKQLAVLALAMAEPEALDLPDYRGLRWSVMAPRVPNGPGVVRFHCYLHAGSAIFEPTFAAIKTGGGRSPTVLCHVAREPLGYICTTDDQASLEWAAERRLCDISGFGLRQPGQRTEHLMLAHLRASLPTRTKPAGVPR